MQIGPPQRRSSFNPAAAPSPTTGATRLGALANACFVRRVIGPRWAEPVDRSNAVASGDAIVRQSSSRRVSLSALCFIWFPIRYLRSNFPAFSFANEDIVLSRLGFAFDRDRRDRTIRRLNRQTRELDAIGVLCEIDLPAGCQEPRGFGFCHQAGECNGISRIVMNVKIESVPFS